VQNVRGMALRIHVYSLQAYGVGGVGVVGHDVLLTTGLSYDMMDLWSWIWSGVGVY
jgi:hypothetical protein